MSKLNPPSEVISDSFIAEIVTRASTNERVRRSLPGGGWIHLDRRLPFLCVYRRPALQADPGTEQLVTSEAASLVSLAGPRAAKRLSDLVSQLAASLSAYFGAFLLVEVWAGREDDLTQPVHEESGEPLPPRPAFTISTRRLLVPQSTVGTLAKSLRKIKALRNQLLHR